MRAIKDGERMAKILVGIIFIIAVISYIITGDVTIGLATFSILMFIAFTVIYCLIKILERKSEH